MAAKLIAEFLGTFFLVAAVLLVVNNDVGWIGPIAIGATLMTVVYLFGSISGAHFNPAVSLGMCVRGRLSPLDLVLYWVVQFCGAGAALHLLAVGMGIHGPAGRANFPLAGMIIYETIWTFLLVMVIFEVATRKATAGNKYFGFAIGGTVTLGAILIGPLTGGAFNPAVGMTAMVNGPFPTAYFVGPLLGGALAGLAFRVLRPSDIP